MGLDEMKRHSIRSMPKDKKFIMIQQHLSKEQDKTSGKIGAVTGTYSPSYFIKFLNSQIYSKPSNDNISHNQSGASNSTANSFRKSAASFLCKFVILILTSSIHYCCVQFLFS
jgi:hypothetical protein